MAKRTISVAAKAQKEIFPTNKKEKEDIIENKQGLNISAHCTIQALQYLLNFPLDLKPFFIFVLPAFLKY